MWPAQRHGLAVRGGSGSLALASPFEAIKRVQRVLVHLVELADQRTARDTHAVWLARVRKIVAGIHQSKRLNGEGLLVLLLAACNQMVIVQPYARAGGVCTPQGGTLIGVLAGRRRVPVSNDPYVNTRCPTGGACFWNPTADAGGIFCSGGGGGSGSGVSCACAGA